MSKSKSVEESTVEWLNSEGYYLEYVTSRAFVDAGLRPNMSTYVTSKEGVVREIDVTAQLQEFELPIPYVRVMCECKYSQGRPWVILDAELAKHLWADWTSIPQSQRIHQLARCVDGFSEDLGRSWHFAGNWRYGHNLVQLHRGKQDRGKPDIAFQSLQKISNAAWDWVDTADNTDVDNSQRAVLMAIPCLVVDGPLLLAWFDDKSKSFAAKQIPMGRLSWSGCRSGTVVDIVHVSAIEKYASIVKTTLEILIRVASELVTFAPPPT